MGLKNHDPYFWTQKIDPVSDIRNMGIITAGDVYWVSKVTDSDHTARTDAYGRKVVKTGLQAAIDASVNDANDYILVISPDGGTAFDVGTAVDLNKDRVHLLGLGYNKSKRSYSSTIRDNFGTTRDTEVLAVTGDGCEVGGLRFLGTLGTHAGGTMSNGVAYLSAHDFWAHDAIFEDSTDIWGTPPVVRGAGTATHDARFDDCVFAISGTGNVEGAGNAALVLGGAGNKRWEFYDSNFSLPAGSTTETLFTPGTGVKEYTRFKRCHFGLANGTKFAVTSAIRGSTTANSPILVQDCTILGFVQAGTDPNVWVTPVESGTAAYVYNPNIAVGTGAIVAV